MPELPEVETMRRGIAAVVGCRIGDVAVTDCKLRPIGLRPALPQLRKRAVGATIVDLGRVGKRVIVELDTQDKLVFEPRMTGLVLVADPPNREHLRLRVTLERGGVKELLSKYTTLKTRVTHHFLQKFVVVWVVRLGTIL